VLYRVCQLAVVDKVWGVFVQIRKQIVQPERDREKAHGFLAVPWVQCDCQIDCVELSKELIEGLPFTQYLLLLV